MENITDSEYNHAKRVWENFRIENIVEFHDLYIESDTLLLAHVFERFHSKCTEIYKFDPVYFSLALWLAWQTCLNKTGLELELLADADMPLTVEKGIGGEMCNDIYW